MCNTVRIHYRMHSLLHWPHSGYCDMTGEFPNKEDFLNRFVPNEKSRGIQEITILEITPINTNTGSPMNMCKNCKRELSHEMLYLCDACCSQDYRIRQVLAIKAPNYVERAVRELRAMNQTLPAIQIIREWAATTEFSALFGLTASIAWVKQFPALNE